MCKLISCKQLKSLNYQLILVVFEQHTHSCRCFATLGCGWLLLSSIVACLTMQHWSPIATDSN